IGAGRKRFQRVPSLTKQLFTNSSSTSSGAPASSALRSALAMALRKTFSMCLAARFGVKRSVCSAACALCPRIKSITSRAFCGDMRTCRARACASIEPACGCSSAMAYAFGAAGAAPPPAPPAGAPPPAGAAPAAFSSAAFAAWPLKVGVGENSPSLCPIICSVTYTGMNFLPLCTAMVWPIISGTIVERRDQVFTTFFSLRVFRPSPFSRRWPSTNGPFFSERAIDSLFLHSPQPTPLSAPQLLESPHWPRYTVRLGAERADKTRALRVWRAFHDHRPAWFAQLVQHWLQRHGNHSLHHRACGRLVTLHRCAFRGRALDWPVVSPACCAPCSCCSCRSHCLCSRRAALVSPPGF